jgi:hypothetical protein
VVLLLLALLAVYFTLRSMAKKRLEIEEEKGE